MKYYYAGSARVAERQGSALSFLLADHLGSTAITADSSGSKIAELRYKAWGETRYSSGTTPTNRRYTGQILDSYINLYWMGSRWYDPYLNRWIQPDSIIPDPYNPQDWDRYAYVRNNPVNATDPTGHMPSKCPDGACDGNLHDKDKNYRYHTVLMGQFPGMQPLKPSEDTTCGGCSVEPQLPNNAAGAVANGAGVASDAGIAAVAIAYNNAPREINVFLNYETSGNDSSNSLGDINVTSIEVQNGTGVSIGVNYVAFQATADPKVCQGVCGPVSTSYNYLANPPRITTPNSGLGVIPSYGTNRISLNPSGNYNPNNTFSPIFNQVNVTTDLAYNFPGSGNGRTWPAIWYTITR